MREKYRDRDSRAALARACQSRKLDDIADRDNNLGERTFLCCWEDADVDWLLIEDTEAAM
ncbi:MAG: hypothetical protein EA424_25895 [Planctomycetaceae bacterium]|nr:MAG: hypothetical protein EA424_25895 [Planctomycetaceae bacterium]